jgi:hypothetical protein
MSKFIGGIVFGLFISFILIVFMDSTTNIHEDEYSVPKIDTFTISCGTFPSDVRVLITEDTTFALKYIQRYYSSIEAVNLRNTEAETFCLNGQEPPLIWLKCIDEEFTPVIHHELFHAISSILRYSDIQLCDSTDEVYAYELEYLSNQLYEHIKGVR